MALSTVEEDHIALASTAQESLLLQQLLEGLKKDSAKAMVVFEGNQSAICMAKDPQFHGRSNHVSIEHHFIRVKVSSGNVELQYS